MVFCVKRHMDHCIESVDSSKSVAVTRTRGKARKEVLQILPHFRTGSRWIVRTYFGFSLSWKENLNDVILESDGKVFNLRNLYTTWHLWESLWLLSFNYFRLRDIESNRSEQDSGFLDWVGSVMERMWKRKLLNRVLGSYVSHWGLYVFIPSFLYGNTESDMDLEHPNIMTVQKS